MEIRPDPSTIHFFLYAKHHYKTNLTHTEALRVLVVERCALPLEYVGKRDIYANLFIALRQIENLNWERIFGEFIERFEHPKFGPIWEGYNDNTDDSKFNFMMKFLALSKISDIKFNITKEHVDPQVQRLLDERMAELATRKWKGLGWG